MRKNNWSSISVLSIILVGVSLIAVAMFPDQGRVGENADGSLTDSLDGSQIVQTCTLTAGSIGARCNVTSGTLTTSDDAVNSSDQFFFQTVNNTTTI